MSFRVFQSLPEALTYGLLILMLMFNVAGLFISAQNANQAKIIAAQNQRFAEASQRQTIDARKANVQRQNEIKDYIKCLALLRFEEPPITVNSNKQETVAALDKCARVE